MDNKVRDETLDAVKEFYSERMAALIYAEEAVRMACDKLVYSPRLCQAIDSIRLAIIEEMKYFGGDDK